MASSLSTGTIPAAIVAKPNNGALTASSQSSSKLSFHLSPKSKIRLFTKGLRTGQNHSTVTRAQLHEVPVDGSSKAAASSTKSEAKTPADDSKPSSAELATEEAISSFMNQVSSLVKLVDSRDIVELQLKQFDCELVIRKKEALPQPPPPQVVMMQSPSQAAMMPPASAPSPAPAAPTPSPASSASPAKPPALPAAAKASLPTIKCPMAGTFYRSPAPGEPPFVKVGDKIQKGQVLCIVEAMKLMNEIEADKSGTIVEILAEEGKPVSVDTPLFVIQP